MPKWQQTETSQVAQGSDTPPNAVDLIVNQLLIPWCHEHGRLPQPCPTGMRDCAIWWLTHMQEPEAKGETYQVACVGAGLRWETGYANRSRSALLGFLSLPDDHSRRMVAQMVTEDRIPCRGDDIRMFYEIAEETLTMRDDPDAYKRNTLSRLKSAYQTVLMP